MRERQYHVLEHHVLEKSSTAARDRLHWASTTHSWYANESAPGCVAGVEAPSVDEINSGFSLRVQGYGCID
jgi:hypothetical protein